MRSTHGDKRFWESTRGRIILLLRGGSRTVHELAVALGLTDNAVRTHLTALDRDGLVQPSGMRPGTRKPIVTYHLTPESERLFPKMYGPILRHFLDVLNERIPRKKLDDIVRAVGHQLALQYQTRSQAGAVADHGHQAIRVLRELGGFCDSERHNGTIVLRCSDCPLSLVVARHPEVCRMMETMLTDLLGVPVRQRCETEPTLQCRFEIETSMATQGH